MREWSHAVTTVTPATNGTTDHSRNAVSDSPTIERVTQAAIAMSS